MSRPTHPGYKTMNWPAYYEALKRRGSLTVWFDPAMTWEAAPTGKCGRQPDYSDAAIQTCLTMEVLFGMALRQTTGFVEGLLGLIGFDWTVPIFSTLSRRQKTLKVQHSLLWIRRSVAPVDRQHRHQGRGRRRVECPQAWWHEAECLAQDPHRK
jgi:hypothetical protein